MTRFEHILIAGFALLGTGCGADTIGGDPFEFAEPPGGSEPESADAGGSEEPSTDDPRSADAGLSEEPWTDDPCIDRVFEGETADVDEAQERQVVTGLLHEFDHVVELLVAFYDHYDISPPAACSDPVESGRMQLRPTCSSDGSVLKWIASDDGEDRFKIEVTVSDLEADTWSPRLYLGAFSDYHNGHGGWGDEGWGNRATGSLHCLTLQIEPDRSVTLLAAGSASVDGEVVVPETPFVVSAEYENGRRVAARSMVASAEPADAD